MRLRKAKIGARVDGMIGCSDGHVRHTLLILVKNRNTDPR